MTSGETEFQFELNETLYFDDGYHVQELISIAVDPEITIHPYDTYVSIRGKIELQGEYIKEQEEQTKEEFTLDLEDFQAKRLIEKVSATENNQMEFSHRFPVEISIPSYRIQAIDDIHVEIVNFDYEFPASNQLNLTALAVIHGMKEEFDLLEGKRRVESELEVPELPSFEFEIKKREDDEENEDTIQNPVDEITTLPKMNEKQHSDEELKLTLEERNERIEEELTTNQQEEELVYKEEHKEEQKEKVEERIETVIEIEAESNEEDETIKDVGYLADMFRGNDEENYSRMRICIVQEDDTIETIAERFEISTLQLIKQNKLEEDFDINEGQLLYIPKK